MNNLLIVGLGNPGKEYQKTRHNAGADFVNLLTKKLEINLKKEDKFFGLYSYKKIGTFKIHFSIPEVYMNESGRFVRKIKDYFKLKTSDLLVVHDELDLPIGKIKFKESGGHGGHNGIKNIIDNLQGDSSFKRLRIGIDHPAGGSDVTNYVLSKANTTERNALNKAMKKALPVMDLVFEGKWQEALLELHTAERI
tara:strand:+ start:358 stop:942 length:585 start_codon:yes stop_codon:yes gene_type:complete